MSKNSKAKQFFNRGNSLRKYVRLFDSPFDNLIALYSNTSTQYGKRAYQSQKKDNWTNLCLVGGR